MSLTVKESWKMRKKIVGRPRTYEQALAIYTYSKEVAESANSRAGGYHRALASNKTRQYPLIFPYWPRTYVGMLAAETNASRLDHTMYTNNDQVPEGRIAFYYAGSGPLSQSLELVLWHPDGRCLISPIVLETFQWGRRYRAESFADVSLWSDRGRDCIRTRRESDGTIRGIWCKKKVPRSTLPKSQQEYHAEIKDDETPPGMTWIWGKDYTGVFLIDRYSPLVVPKRRNQRPYLLRGVADWPYDPEADIPRLTSWAEERAATRARTKVHRKMAGVMQSMRNNPELLSYFVQMHGRELSIRGTTLETPRALQATQAATVPQPIAEFLEAGSRHDRHLFLDE
jgi:hypothetical protein